MTILRFLPLAVLALATGCNRHAKPTGDVVATVDGRDITTGDLQAEARSRGIRFDTPDGSAARAAVLRFVVSRELLVGRAKKDGFDTKPAILAEKRREEAGILAQAEVAKMMASAPPITPAQVDAYRAANPQTFARRQMLTVNRAAIQLTSPLPNEPRDTMEAVLAQAAALRLPVQQDQPTIDSATIPRQTFEALLAHPDVPLRVDNGLGTATFVTLASAKPAPAPEDQQKQAATHALQAQWLDTSIAGSFDQMRKAGTIQFKPGYQP